MPINIPNALTILRILLIPVLVIVFYVPFRNHLMVAAVIFAFAAVTDWVDGYLARRLDQMTTGWERIPHGRKPGPRSTAANH